MDKIHNLAWTGDETGLEELLSSGADVNMPTTSLGDTPLGLAVAGGHVSCCALLIKRGKNTKQY